MIYILSITLRTPNYGNYGVVVIIMALLWVMQDLYRQPWDSLWFGFRARGGILWFPIAYGQALLLHAYCNPKTSPAQSDTGMKTPNPETPSILGFLESLGLGDMVDINPALPTIRYIP